jgi:hypothetical protein
MGLMTKRIIGACVLAMALTACGGTEDDSRIVMTTDEGQSMTLMKGPGVAEEPVASFEESDENGARMAAGCWVVLDYCRDPATGDVVCHWTNCTVERAFKECKALYRKYC